LTKIAQNIIYATCPKKRGHLKLQQIETMYKEATPKTRKTLHEAIM